MSIGENLKRLREEKKYTQEQLANEVDVKQHMLSQVERGTRALTLPLASNIAKVLEIDINEFLK